jgi:hypothetical protein
MKTLTYTTAAIIVMALSSFSFTSNLTVPAHEQFYLGGGQKASFTARAKNVGKVPVTLLLLAPDGTETTLLVLAPGKEAKATAPAKVALLVRNENDVEANLVVKGPGSPESLNMYYKKESEYKK